MVKNEPSLKKIFETVASTGRAQIQRRFCEVLRYAYQDGDAWLGREYWKLWYDYDLDDDWDLPSRNIAEQYAAMIGDAMFSRIMERVAAIVGESFDEAVVDCRKKMAPVIKAEMERQCPR